MQQIKILCEKSVSLLFVYMDAYIDIDTGQLVCHNNRKDGEQGQQIYEYYKDDHLIMKLEQIIGDLNVYRNLYKLKYTNDNGSTFTGIVVGISSTKYKVVIMPHNYYCLKWDFNEQIKRLCVTTVKRNTNGQFDSSIFSVNFLSNRLEEDNSIKTYEVFNFTSDVFFVGSCHYIETESKDHNGDINIGIHDTYNTKGAFVPKKLSKLKYLFKTKFCRASIYKICPSKLPKLSHVLLFHDDVLLPDLKLDDIEGMDTFLDPTIKLRKHFANHFVKIYQRSNRSNIYKSGVCNNNGNIIVPIQYNLILSCGNYILADSDIFHINKDLSATLIFHGYHLHFVAIMNGYFAYEKKTDGVIQTFIVNSEGKQEKIEGANKLIQEFSSGDSIYYDCKSKRFLYCYYKDYNESSCNPNEDYAEMYKDAFEGDPEYEWNID